MTETLTDEEIKTLKEIARNLQAASRISKIAQTGLLWIAGVIGAWVVVWEFILKGWGKV